jgi:DNA-binding response OmpR family regulator
VKILILEDSLERIKAFKQRCLERGIVMHHTDEVEECIGKLSTDQYSAIFLDHDLGDQVYQNSDDRNCGAEVARWLSRNEQYVPEYVFLHSLNEPGRARMKQLLPHAVEVPFAWVRFPL